MNDLKHRYASKYCEASEDYYVFDKHDDQFLSLSETAKALNEKDKRIAELERERQESTALYEEMIKTQADAISLFTDTKVAKRRLAKRDIEQQIKALESAVESLPDHYKGAHPSSLLGGCENHFIECLKQLKQKGVSDGRKI